MYTLKPSWHVIPQHLQTCTCEGVWLLLHSCQYCLLILVPSLNSNGTTQLLSELSQALPSVRPSRTLLTSSKTLHRQLARVQFQVFAQLIFNKDNCSGAQASSR